jgi:hypothetical protein
MKKLLSTFVLMLLGQVLFATCTASFTSTVSGLHVLFNNTSTGPGGTSVYPTYTWYYGDGNHGIANGYTYTAAGTYTACLVAVWTDSLTHMVVCSDSNCNNVTVTGTTVNQISGNLSDSGCMVSGATYNIWLISYNATTQILTAVDSIISSTSTAYTFNNEAAATYRVKAWVTNATSSPAPLPTYGFDSLHWNAADSFVYSGTGVSSGHNINLLCGTLTSGPGFIGGNVTMGANKAAKTTGVPDPNVEILISNATGPIGYAFTDASGNYSFSNLPVPGTYTIYPEVLGYQNTPWIVTLTTNDESVSSINFQTHTASHYTNTITGIENVAVIPANISVYPNPSTGLVNISSNIAGQVVISDVVGHKVFETQINTGNSKLNLADLQAGMYFINIKATGLNYSDKLLIQH